MKKLSVNLFLFFLLLSIILSELLSTSIDSSLDGSHAILNAYLPIILGVLSTIFLVPVFLSVKEARFRKTLVGICIASNLIFGMVLKSKYPLSENVKKEDVLLNDNHKSNFYLVSDGNTKIKNIGVKVVVPDSFASNDHLYFSKLSDNARKILSKKPGAKLNVKEHYEVTIRVENGSNKELIISKAAFLKNDLWKISKVNNLGVDESIFPISIGTNKFADVTIDFTGDKLEKRAKKTAWNALFKLQWNLLQYGKKMDCKSDLLSSCITFHDELVLYSNDKAFKRLYLNGLWQYRAEGDWEPDLQKILTNLSFNTKIGFKYFDNGSNGEAVVPNSDEVAVSYFERANDTAGVKIIQLAAYHAFSSIREDDALRFFYKRDKSVVKLFSNEPGAAQLILPKMLVKPNVNFISFYPKEAFGFVMGSSNTDRTKNYKNKIGVRVWKAINSKGETLKNSYIIGVDFIGQPRTNYDYQDNVYLIENVKPFNSQPSKLMANEKKLVGVSNLPK